MPTVKQYQKGGTHTQIFKKGGQKTDLLAQNRELLNNPQVQAMLKTIRYAEGTAGERGYNTRVGYGQFDDLSKKPGKKAYIPAIKDYSTAEGAYQFLNSTWDGVSKKLGLKDFSPESQDLAAIELIKNRGALTDVLNNNLTGALSKLSKEWASLPTAEGKSAYGNQKSKKLGNLANVFYGQNQNYENSVAPYMNAPKPFTTIQVPEMQTQQVNYLEIPTETTTLAEETKPKINPQEEAFMQDLLSQMAEGVAYVEPEKSAVFQDGGEKNSLWKNIRANRGSGKKPTKEMLEQERKIKSKEDGGVIKDNNGYWNPQNWGKNVEISSPQISMKNVSQTLLGVADTGERKIMKTDNEYNFIGASKVTEIPLTQAEENFLKGIYETLANSEA